MYIHKSAPIIRTYVIYMTKCLFDFIFVISCSAGFFLVYLSVFSFFKRVIVITIFTNFIFIIFTCKLPKLAKCKCAKNGVRGLCL